MLSTYLGDDAEALDGLEFLTMAEAGEVGHWEIVSTMARKARDRNVTSSPTGPPRSSSPPLRRRPHRVAATGRGGGPERAGVSRGGRSPRS